MKKALEDGYEELVVEVTKTIQVHEYEPLKVRVALKKHVLPEEVSAEFRKTTELLETEICDYLGLP